MADVEVVARRLPGGRSSARRRFRRQAARPRGRRAPIRRIPQGFRRAAFRLASRAVPFVRPITRIAGRLAGPLALASLVGELGATGLDRYGQFKQDRAEIAAELAYRKKREDLKRAYAKTQSHQVQRPDPIPSGLGKQLADEHGTLVRGPDRRERAQRLDDGSRALAPLSERLHVYESDLALSAWPGWQSFAAPQILASPATAPIQPPVAVYGGAPVPWTRHDYRALAAQFTGISHVADTFLAQGLGFSPGAGLRGTQDPFQIARPETATAAAKAGLTGAQAVGVSSETEPGAEPEPQPEPNPCERVARRSKRKSGQCRQGYFSEDSTGTRYITWSTRKCPSSKKPPRLRLVPRTTTS